MLCMCVGTLWERQEAATEMLLVVVQLKNRDPVLRTHTHDDHHMMTISGGLFPLVEAEEQTVERRVSGAIMRLSFMGWAGAD